MNRPLLLKYVSNNNISKRKSDSWSSNNLDHITKRVNVHYIYLRDSKPQFKLVMHDPVTLTPIYSTETHYTKEQANLLWKQYIKSISLIELD